MVTGRNDATLRDANLRLSLSLGDGEQCCNTSLLTIIQVFFHFPFSSLNSFVNLAFLALHYGYDALKEFQVCFYKVYDTAWL